MFSEGVIHNMIHFPLEFQQLLSKFDRVVLQVLVFDDDLASLFDKGTHLVSNSVKDFRHSLEDIEHRFELV